MRTVIDLQTKLFGKSIENLEFDINSRDEIPQLLSGLQYIYKTPNVREQVYGILREISSKLKNPNTGRPGMDLWKILVLGTIRLDCNLDYDKLMELANEHRSIRIIMGHEENDFSKRYALQTIKDNVPLLTPSMLDRISLIVVESGHRLLGKKSDDLRGRCDSYVVETDVCYPTDLRMLFDSMRKAIEIIALICSNLGLTEWRLHASNTCKIKKLYNLIRTLRRSRSKQAKKKVEREDLIKSTCQSYLGLIEWMLFRIDVTISSLEEEGLIDFSIKTQLMVLENYLDKAETLKDQINRRIMQGEKIPHDEKIFSIFEEHTEWIVKGKAGISQELGKRVAILEDQFGFILNYEVMDELTDEKIAIKIVEGAKNRFKGLVGCSFDRGFYSRSNKTELKSILDYVVLPKKGRLSAADKEEEYSESFIKTRKQHSAVESGISALENHGLDRCPDHGLYGFKRYVALGILARNIQILGSIIQKKEKKRIKRQQNRRKAA